MTNLLNIPIEDNFRTTLTRDFAADSDVLEFYVASVPTGAIPAGQKIRVTIDSRRGFTYMEEVLVESIDATNKKLTCSVGGRAQVRYNGDQPSPLLHYIGGEVIISNPYGLWLEAQTAINSKLDLSGGTMTGPITKVRYQNAAARDAAITSPVNGQEVYLIDEGYNTDRIAGSWVQRATGAVGLAADHSAGKLDVASQTEMQNGTATDATSGAFNAVCVNVTAAVSTGAAQYGIIPRGNSSGKLDNSWLDLPGLGAVPTGVVLPWAGDTAPTGYLLADGSSVSKTTYKALFFTSGIGITYGNGSNNSLASATFTADTGTDKLTSAAHGLTTNSTVTVSSSGTLPSPLVGATTYYVINPTTNDFQLSTTKGGSAINITSTGSGTHTWTAQLIADAADDTIYLAAHGLSNDDVITFTSTGVLPTGITAGTGYYVINKTTNNFQISTTQGGSAVNITAAGTPTHSLQKNFLLPNLKGRVPVGRDAAQTEFDVLGETGGEKTHTMTSGELVAHTHTTPSNSSVAVSSGSGANPAANAAGVTGSTGSTTPFNVLQPYIVLNYIIKT